MLAKDVAWLFWMVLQHHPSQQLLALLRMKRLDRGAFGFSGTWDADVSEGPLSGVWDDGSTELQPEKVLTDRLKVMPFPQGLGQSAWSSASGNSSSK